MTLVYSFLPETREIVASMGPAASVSARAWPKVLESFGILLVQDSLDLAERQPENKIHAMLLADDEFQCVACNVNCKQSCRHNACCRVLQECAT